MRKMPFTKTLWLLHDQSNSNEKCYNYVWWFETRKLALSFKRHHKKLKNYSSLIGPFRARMMD